METFDLTFQVAHIIYINNGYAVLRAKSVRLDKECDRDDVSSYTICGKFNDPKPGDKYDCQGVWVRSKYGWQIESLSYTLSVPKTKSSMQKFLQKNLPGCGPTMAKRIVDAFGTNSLDIIKNEPEKVAALPRISKKKAAQFQGAATNLFKIEETAKFLKKFGFDDYELIGKICEKLESPIAAIKSNPYCLVRVLPLSSFVQIDELARSMAVPVNDVSRVSELILYYLRCRLFEKNDLYVPYREILQDMYYYLSNHGIFVQGICQKDIDETVVYMLKNWLIEHVEDKIFLKSSYDMEHGSAKLLYGLSKSQRTAPDIDKFFGRYEKRCGIVCSPEQQSAVKAAYENGVTVITGLPGTGKTLTVSAIIQYYKFAKQNAKIILAAPTGRAAKRMTELTGEKAQTIHRLLHLCGDDDTPEAESIEADVVICDEMSMVTTKLFYNLLCALNKNTRLVLVGDVNQLPPVGAGRPFKDMIDSETVPVVRLEKLYRQAERSQININARNILMGSGALSLNLSLQDFFFFEGTGSLMPVIKETYERLIKCGEKQDNIVVLAPVKKGEDGVIELNNNLQNLINPEVPGSPVLSHGDYIFRIQDRVMQTKNNYDLNVFNGDMGKIKEITRDDDGKHVTVVYDDYEQGGTRSVVYGDEHIGELTLAYAMTVHKAQGSEFSCVIMPVKDRFTNMTKSLIYTAVTRAKKRFVFVGSKPAYERGVHREVLQNENTYFKEFLKEELKDEESTACSREAVRDGGN